MAARLLPQLRRLGRAAQKGQDQRIDAQRVTALKHDLSDLLTRLRRGKGPPAMLEKIRQQLQEIAPQLHSRKLRPLSERLTTERLATVSPAPP